MQTGTHEHPEDRRRRAGFTLVELLVVMGVILVLVVMTLPAFRAIQKSGRLSGAINAVTNTLSNARAQAVREGRDVAVLFRFDTLRQTCSMEVLRAEGVVYDADQASGRMNAATVFAAIKGQAPVTLPRGAGVLGYGYGASRGNVSNYDNWYPDLGNLYQYSGNNRSDPWLQPRTDPRVIAEDQEPNTSDVQRLETFIIRFSPEGTVVSNAEELGSLARGGDGFLELDDPDHPEYFVWRPQVRPGGNLREEVVHAEYQLRAVPMLVVVDLLDMGADLAIREPWMALGQGYPVERSDANGNGVEDQKEINDWVEANATPISFNRFTGELMRGVKR